MLRHRCHLSHRLPINRRRSRINRRRRRISPHSKCSKPRIDVASTEVASMAPFVVGAARGSCHRHHNRRHFNLPSIKPRPIILLHHISPRPQVDPRLRRRLGLGRPAHRRLGLERAAHRRLGLERAAHRRLGLEQAMLSMLIEAAFPMRHQHNHTTSRVRLVTMCLSFHRRHLELGRSSDATSASHKSSGCAFCARLKWSV